MSELRAGDWASAGGLPAAIRPVGDTGPRRSSRVSPVVLAGTVRAVEVLAVVATGIAVYWLYLSHTVPLGPSYVATLMAMGIAASLAFQAIGSYSMTAFRMLARTALKLAFAWTCLFLVAPAAIFFLKASDAFSRIWLIGWYVLGFAAILLVRAVVLVAVTRMARIGLFDRRTALVGGGAPAEAIINALATQPESGIRLVGVFDDRDDVRSPRSIAGAPKLGSVSDLVAFARKNPLDLVIFTLPVTAEERLLQMLTKLWVLPVDIRLSAHSSKLRFRPRSYSYIGDVPVLDVIDRPIADWDLVSKWVFDKIVGAILLVLTSPILLAAAIAVKYDSRGPVLFRQKRYGFNNELIEVFKFRSMYVDSSDATASRLVTRDDPRVTRVGRFLRRTSIDELPQLFNVVFKGNLSLVGPRPHALHAKAANELYDQAVDGYFARHKVKPGITGWAQINGWRGETDTHEKLQHRIEHDLYYIEHWSVLFDLAILLGTPLALIRTENAY